MVNGQEVKYVGGLKCRKEFIGKYGVTCSEPYEIRVWKFINVLFDDEEEWRPINLDHLKTIKGN